MLSLQLKQHSESGKEKKVLIEVTIYSYTSIKNINKVNAQKSISNKEKLNIYY